jgi:predicted NAD/FAD-dependent oxidoreductase
VAHRWRYGRLAPSDHLVRPLVLDRPGSVGRLGLAGDLFDPDGGLQGAWRSGRNLGARLVFSPDRA